MAISKLNNKIIIGRDFNSHHKNRNCRNDNSNGHIVNQFASTANFTVVAPSYPTCYRSASIIEFFLLKNIYQPSRIERLRELFSDYNPVLMEVNISSYSTSHKRAFIMNWVALNNTQYPLPAIHSEDELDAVIEDFTSTLNRALKNSKAVPLTGRARDPAIRELLANRKRARKIWQRTRCPEVKRILNRLNQEVSTRTKQMV
ncbi:MAG: hypothetical protein E7Y34_02330 [Mycoplasma sp.]|nr:hypothetical protein [Mycoplasma sp.]